MIKKIITLGMLFLTTTICSAEIKKIKAKVDGMVCAACVTTMKQLLNKVSAVQSVDNIDLKNGFVTISLKDNNTETVDSIAQALRDAIQKSNYTFTDISVIDKK